VFAVGCVYTTGGLVFVCEAAQGDPVAVLPNVGDPQTPVFIPGYPFVTGCVVPITAFVGHIPAAGEVSEV